MILNISCVSLWLWHMENIIINNREYAGILSSNALNVILALAKCEGHHVKTCFIKDHYGDYTFGNYNGL